MSRGRGVFWKKTTVEEATQLDMKRLSKDVDFNVASEVTSTWTWSSGKTTSIGITVEPRYALHFRYTVTDYHSGEKRDIAYQVDIEATPCFYGGQRWWFWCPGCGRRCRILYFAPGSDYFACRICHNLSYQSQQEGKSRVWYLGRALFDVPKWYDELWRTNSRKKRRALWKKIREVEAGVPAAMASLKGKRKKKRKRRKR